MRVQTSEPATVASLLHDLLADNAADRTPGVGGEVLDELLGWFRSECATIAVGCPAEAIPLRMPKARISELLSCERGMLARLGRTELAEPIVRGRLTDLLVAQHATIGLGPVCSVAEVEADLRDGLEAAGDLDVLEWLAGEDDDVKARMWSHGELVARRLVDTWGELPRSWWPRSQERVSVDVADGVINLAAQFDLALGGPPTGSPAVIIEVKAGNVSDVHRQDLLWYALLWALRHGEAPVMMATWTASDGGLVPVPVTAGALESAARRGLAALARLVDLAAGAAPTVSPYVGCNWCPELDRCPPGLAWIESPRQSGDGRTNFDTEHVRDQGDDGVTPWE